jgi:hypothetical protein
LLPSSVDGDAETSPEPVRGLADGDAVSLDPVVPLIVSLDPMLPLGDDVPSLLVLGLAVGEEVSLGEPALGLMYGLPP